MVPNLFGTRNQFHGRQFFHRPQLGGGFGFRMIQVRYTHCALFFFHFFLSLHQLHFRSSDIIRSWRLGTSALPHTFLLHTQKNLIPSIQQCCLKPEVTKTGTVQWPTSHRYHVLQKFPSFTVTHMLHSHPYPKSFPQLCAFSRPSQPPQNVLTPYF